MDLSPEASAMLKAAAKARGVDEGWLASEIVRMALSEFVTKPLGGPGYMVKVHALARAYKAPF